MHEWLYQPTPIRASVGVGLWVEKRKQSTNHKGRPGKRVGRAGITRFRPWPLLLWSRGKARPDCLPAGPPCPMRLTAEWEHLDYLSISSSIHMHSFTTCCLVCCHHSESTTHTWLLMITSLIIRLVSLIDPACNEVNLTAGNGIVRFGQFCVALTYYSTIKSSLSTLKHMMILVPFRVFCTIKYAVSHACSAFCKIVMHC